MKKGVRANASTITSVINGTTPWRSSAREQSHGTGSSAGGCSSSCGGGGGGGGEVDGGEPPGLWF